MRRCDVFCFVLLCIAISRAAVHLNARNKCSNDFTDNSDDLLTIYRQITSPWAIKFKSHRYFPGPMENITIRRIEMGKIGPTPWMYPKAAGSAFLLGLSYGGKPPARGRPGKPRFRNVTFEDISVVSAGVAGRIEGLPEDCLEGLTLRNIDVIGGRATWICNNVDLNSLTVTNVHPSVSCMGGCNSSTGTPVTGVSAKPSAATRFTVERGRG